MTDIDESDLKILRILKQDSRTSVATIAEQVGMSTSTCWRRISALEASGVIERFTVNLDPEAMGLGFRAIVHIQLTRHDKEKIDTFFEAVRSKPEVQQCYAVTGQSDYHMIINCRDLNAYNHFLDNFLFQIQAVASAQTNLVLKTIKDQSTGV